MPVIAQQSIAPQELLDIISCGCRSEGKACAQKNCKCHSNGLSCTEYCECGSGEKCNNPFTTFDEDDIEEEEEGIVQDDIEEDEEEYFE